MKERARSGKEEEGKRLEWRDKEGLRTGLEVGKPWRISAQLHPTVTAAAVSRPRTFVRRGFRVRWGIASARECREDHRRLSFIDQLILRAVL